MPARLRRGLRFDPQMVLQVFNRDGQAAEALAQEPALPPYDDVLDAYCSLPQRRVPRLVVLGEPGAGKSFSLERISCHHARRALRDADWYARIRDALERADAVVGVFGTESAACRWQQREMLRADRLTLPVLAFAIGATPLPMYVIEKQPVALRDPRDPAP